jgi:ABC-type glycerol-3-phosphate transport system permease component
VKIVPIELFDAARVNGAGEFRQYSQIMLTLTIMVFIVLQRYFIEDLTLGSSK